MKDIENKINKQIELYNKKLSIKIKELNELNQLIENSNKLLENINEDYILNMFNEDELDEEYDDSELHNEGYHNPGESFSNNHDIADVNPFDVDPFGVGNEDSNNDFSIEGLEELSNELKLSMSKKDASKYDRYLAAANMIKGAIPHKEIYVEVLESTNKDRKLTYDMNIKVAGANGSENILSSLEKEAIDSGALTIKRLVEIINSFK